MKQRQLSGWQLALEDPECRPAMVRLTRIAALPELEGDCNEGKKESVSHLLRIRKDCLHLFMVVNALAMILHRFEGNKQ